MDTAGAIFPKTRVSHRDHIGNANGSKFFYAHFAPLRTCWKAGHFRWFESQFSGLLIGLQASKDGHLQAYCFAVHAFLRMIKGMRGDMLEWRVARYQLRS